jgi:cytochrome b
MTMNTLSSSTASVASPGRATTAATVPASPTRRIVDAATRAFHWLFALCFVGAYLSAESERLRLLHVCLGYAMAGLLVFRIVDGLVGPRQVRWSALWSKLSGAATWLRSLSQARSWADVNLRQGQNLLMVLMVVVLMALVVPVTLTGYASFNDWGGEWLSELHEGVGEAFLWGVIGHLGALLAISLTRRQNLALPMLTGRTPGRGPDLVRHNRVWLALLLTVAVAGYLGWEWTQSPRGLVPLTAVAED